MCSELCVKQYFRQCIADSVVFSGKTVMPKRKPQGRPSLSGHGVSPLTGIRMSDELRKRVAKWSAAQKDKPTVPRPCADWSTSL